MNGFPYLKLFTQARNDPKLRALYRGSPAHFYVWFNLFCYSGEQPERGTVARSLYLIAVEVADGDIELLRNACNAMGALQLVTCDLSDTENAVVSIRNFDKWQDRKKPSEEPERVRERVRKSRENKKKIALIGKIKGDVTPCNGHVTPQCNAIKEAEADEETDKQSRSGLIAGSIESHDEWTHEDCMLRAAEFFGDANGNVVRQTKSQLELELLGHDGRVWWNAMAVAMFFTNEARRGPRPRDIHDPIKYAKKIAKKYIDDGVVPPEPEPALVIRPPQKPAPPAWQPKTVY